MSHAEDLMAFQIRCTKLPAPQREYRFFPERKWRADFGWPEQRVLLEVEGGVWVQGRHTRGTGFVADLEKYNKAATLGYLVLRVTPDMVVAGEALEWLTEALRGARRAA